MRRQTPFRRRRCARDAILAHPVFNSHHTEHAMLRYLKRLQNRDLALDHAMIPLGSCTMKLNAAAEMIPGVVAGVRRIRPFAPPSRPGYRRADRRARGWLRAVTGFDAICMQPNSGAQGEYAGLVAIRRYQAAPHAGQPARNICLIPKSAHGTNPATAQMCGLEVVVVEVRRHGRQRGRRRPRAKAAQNMPPSPVLPDDHLPVHARRVRRGGEGHLRHGACPWRPGYMDGANLNAQVGLTSPADIGADVA